MLRVLFDTNIFVYATGGEHRYRRPCKAVLELQSSGELAGEASTILIQEFAFVRLRRGDSRDNVFSVCQTVAQACTKVHSFTWNDMELALTILKDTDAIRPADAVHAATAINNGIQHILSTDTDFDRIDGIDRIDPIDLASSSGKTLTK